MARLFIVSTKSWYSSVDYVLETFHGKSFFLLYLICFTCLWRCYLYLLRVFCCANWTSPPHLSNKNKRRVYGLWFCNNTTTKLVFPFFIWVRWCSSCGHLTDLQCICLNCVRCVMFVFFFFSIKVFDELLTYLFWLKTPTKNCLFVAFIFITVCGIQIENRLFSHNLKLYSEKQLLDLDDIGYH